MHATIQVVPFDNPEDRRKKVTINDVEVGWIAHVDPTDKYRAFYGQWPHVIEAAFCGEWDSERQAAFAICTFRELDADTLRELLA